jgi:hypothetical protein
MLAVSSASYQFEDLSTFLKVYEESISKASLFLPPGAITGDVANEFKLDLIVPVIGRQGPFSVQVVHRGEDGSLGLHLPEIPTVAQASFDTLFGFIDEVRTMLVASGEFIGRDEYNKMAGQLAVAERAARPSAESDTKAPPRRVVRGIPIPDTSGEQPTLSGTMADRTFRDAMVGMAMEQSTGLLTVKYPDGTARYGYWLRGGPVGWRTEPLNEDEVLGVLLYKAEQITKEQIQESLALMKSDGSRQGEALVKMGVIDFVQLVRVLSKQVEYVLQQVLKDRQGEWMFHVLAELPEQFLTPPMNVPSLLFRGLYTHARDLSGTQLEETLASSMDRYLLIPEEAAHVLGNLQLSRKERGLVDVVLSNSWRLREVFSVSPLGRGQTSAFIWSLMELSLLKMTDQEDQSRTLARIQERIGRKKKSLRGTHFDVLELHWVCMGSEVTPAYERLKQEFSRDRFSDLSPAQEADIQAINAALETAHTVLDSESSRRKYRAEVIEKDTIAGSAEMLGKQGEMAIMRRDRSAACGAFSMAAELVPGESSYRDGLRRATTV